MRCLQSKYPSMFFISLAVVASALSAPAFAQNRALEWYELPVFFQDFSADAQKCVQAHTQSPALREFFLCAKRLSDAGDRTADILVAESLWTGTGTSVSYKAAADLWERSYNSGFVNAAVGLSMPYMTGYGRPRDLAKANALRKEFVIKKKVGLQSNRIAGQINPWDYPSDCSLGIFGCKMVSEKILAEFTVDPQGNVSACSAKGENAKLKEVTCNLISKRFKYMPALDADGRAISSQVTQNVNWAAPQGRPDLSAPAMLTTGTINSNMVPVKLARELNGEYNVVLALKVDILGKVSACRTSGGPYQLTRWVCQTALKGFRFEPAKSSGGRSIESNVTLNYALSFSDKRNSASSISPAPAPPLVPAPRESIKEPSKSVDVNLETAIDRCIRIGFKEIEPGYRECVLEQIRLLSRPK